MGKFDKLNQELVKVNNTQGGPNAAALDDRFQLLNETLVNTQQEWDDYVTRRQQEQEALTEYTHGRGNRSYLRDDYGTRSYTEGMDAVKRRRQQQEWEKANADYEAALQEYNKAAETTRRVSAVAGPMSPEKQREINAAKSTEQSLKERLDALKASADKLKVNDSGFTDWEGRDALVKEYRQLQTELEHQSRRSPERLNRFEEVRKQLQEGDRAAGNKAADYSVRDRSASIFGGAAKRIAGGVANTALTAVDLMEKYSPYMDVAKAVNNRFGSMSPNPAQHRAGMDRLYAAADSISDSAAKDLDRAKTGLGKLGQAGVDIAENVLEMGFDAAVGALTGGGSLVSMFARVFGDSAREARQQGATLEQQVGYGVAAGGIEVLTEKLFDGVAGIYGKGAADNITETVIRRLSSTPTGQTMLRGLIGAINEGNEEVLSDLLNPLAQAIYRDDSLGQLYREVDPAEVLYDFLIGAAVGGLGSVTSAATGQDAAKNAENNYITALYEQSGERPGFGREVRDRAILERQMTNPDAYNAANLSTEENAQEAMRALRGQQTETARAQELQQTQREMTRQNAETNVPAFFSASGITLDDNQRGRLMGTLNDNDISAKNFAIGTRDAYNMGEQGATMEETVQAMGEKYGLSPKQARTAWSFGASNAQTTATGTADVSTEEGRTKVEAALSFLGDRTDDAVKLYDSKQDVGRMATAMNKAVLYAAHGADVQQAVQNARDGKAADVVGVLTDEQAQLAQEIGAERRARQQAADKALGESYREMRQKAAAITGTTTVSAQALEAVDTAIDATRKAGQRVMNEFNELYNALEALEKADPNAKQSDVYKEMLERAFKLRDKAQNAQKQIRDLEKRKAQIEGRKTIQRKKGTVSFGGGTIEGVKYGGVDTAKLSRQQQKVVAMVERLADAVNLDYVFISADAGMGGAYTFGGRVYININAGLGVGNFSQTMAAATISHEMTHWMQQYAPEEYSQLKDFIVQEILKADPQKLQKLIQQQKAWEKGRALTDEQALDEVVANACQTMLLDSKAINKLARQNMSLAARIADWIADWSQKVKDAFAEVDTSQGAIYEAVRALDGSLDRIQELWDNGIEAAAQSYNAQQTVEQANVAQEATNENAAKNIGDVQNQFIGESAETADKDALALARQLDKQGVDNESIRQQTGWFKGMDGKWRYEIDDSGAKYSRRGDLNFRKENPGYNRFRELMEKADAFLLGDSKEWLTEAEQTELTSLKSEWGDYFREDGKPKANSMPRMRLSDYLQHDELFKNYPRLANMILKWEKLTDGRRGEFSPYSNTITLNDTAEMRHAPLDTLAHEIQHAIQKIEDFTPGANISYWLRNGEKVREKQAAKKIERLKAQVQSLEKKLPDVMSQWTEEHDKISDEIDRIEDEIWRIENNKSFDARDYYWNTAGEIEARDVTTRRQYDSDKRKATTPNLGDENTVFAEGAQFQQWSDKEYEELTGSLDEDQLYSAITERKSEENQLREQIKEMKPKEKEWVDKVSANEATLDDFQAWTEDSGYKAMLDRKDKLEKEIRMLYDRWEKARDNRLEREEKEALEKSGLSENEYFGKQAVKVFGYTPYFYDAGYIMSNGKMLNFSGEKGKHRGSRGQDHRAIGQIFATTRNSAAMTRFMNYGNIRIMGESPGIDISSKVEPTAEQYRQIKAFARNVADEEYFSVDLSDERGNNVGTLEYDGTIRPDRIINDIKHFFQTGEVRGAGLSAFYQRWDNTDGDTAAEANGREEAYTRLQSENKAVEDTIAALRKLTEKQGSTIERLRKRLRLTTTPEVREADARKLASNLVKEYGSGAELVGITEQLKALGDYVAQTKDLNADEVKNRAREIARGIVESASEQVSFEDETLTNIRGSIKGKKLTISPDFLGELDQENGFDAFRKRNFGVFTLARADSTSIDRSEYTSVSQFYTDLQSEYGKAYFPDLANEGEEIRTIAAFARAAAPMEVNPFEQYMGEATEELANRISMEVMDGALRLTPATDADKAKSRREALRERIRELQREGKVSEREAKDYERTIQELTDTLDKAQSRYRTLQVTAEQRMAQVRAEGRERAAETMARERARGERKNQKLKEHYQEIIQAARERRQEAAGAGKYRKQIEKKAAKLYDMLAKNDDKLHVPEVLKQPLGEFLESLDFTSKRGLAGGEETQKDKAFGLRLQKIQQILSNQQDYINGGDMKQDLGGYIDVSADNLDFLRRVSEMITTALSENLDFTINQMTAADLKDLSNFLSNLTTAIRNMNSFMANARFEIVREAASKDIESIKALGKASETENGKLFSAAVWENGTPYYVFRRFGDGGKAIFDSFTRGWEKMAFNVQKVMDFTEKTYSDKEVREWQKERHEIELEDGSKVTMTTGQIMSLSMLLNREQARKHMDKGGVRIGDVQGKKGAIKDITHYHLTEADISNIIGQLTDRQEEVARKLQRFMAEQGAEWGNEISMRRFGYNFYTEGENYFPIKTDSADQPMRDTDAQQNSMFRLLNLSASKSLNPKASNALVVEDIFDVFADHMSDMAKLNGMGLPILDAIKWFNFKERIDLGDGQYDTRTMQAAMEQAFGDKALSYFRTLMKDINGVTESGDRGTDIFSKLMSNYKAASVAANLRVAFLQPTSYVRASYLIKPRFLMQAFTNHNAYKEAMENSGTAVWKSLGYYDTNIARGMREQIKHDDSWKDKAVEKSMKLAEIGDQRTWGRLWVACKMQTAAETGLQGEELKQKTADLFREVIYSSQVMDSTLTRSELMRGKTMYSKAMTSFMAEPTLSYNMVMDAGMEYHMNARKYGKAKAWQMSKGYIAKAFTVYACSATFSAVVESVFDALRDDDDDESFFDKWKQAMFGEGNLLTGNLAQDLTIIGKLPYLKSFVSTIQGYKSGDMSLAAFSTAIDAVKIWKETIDLATGALEKPTKTTYYGNMTTWGKIYKTMQAFSQFTGLAVANLSRDVFAVWNTTVGAFNPEWKVRTYESSGDRKRREAVKELTEQGVPKKLALQALQEPDADGNGSLKQDELGPWLNEKIQIGELTGEQADAIWGTQGWKTSFSDYSAKAQKKAQAETSTETPAPAPKPAAAAPTPTPKPQASLSDFESFKKSVSLYSDKKEAAYRGWENEVKPLGVSLDSYVKIINAADAAGDSNGSVKQDEMGMQLVQKINRRELTYEQAEAIWHTIWNGARSKTFYKWYNG